MADRENVLQILRVVVNILNMQQHITIWRLGLGLKPLLQSQNLIKKNVWKCNRWNARDTKKITWWGVLWFENHSWMFL